jgi:hypothetical protein
VLSILHLQSLLVQAERVEQQAVLIMVLLVLIQYFQPSLQLVAAMVHLQMELMVVLVVQVVVVLMVKIALQQAVELLHQVKVMLVVVHQLRHSVAVVVVERERLVQVPQTIQVEMVVMV